MIKKPKINYFSRDFSEIRERLVEHAQKYYPTSVSDLSDANITSFMIDSVAYVGDVLSYYLDFQTNETFLDSAIDSRNVLNLARTMGYKDQNTFTVSGKIAIFMLIPSDGFNSPDYNSVPILKKGSVFSTIDQNIKFLLAEDIFIDEKLIGSNYTVARTNDVGNPTFYAVKFFAPVISGVLKEQLIQVDSFTKFREVFVDDDLVAEIISVNDSDGNEYYQVDNLSQNIVYRPFLATDTNDSSVKYYLKPVSAIRRFVYDNTVGGKLIFGGKSASEQQNLGIDAIVEPNKFILQKYNNDYLQDSYFDPNKLLNGDNFGVGPENTTLSIIYRKNTSANSNVNPDFLQSIDNLLYEFKSDFLVDEATRNIIVQSIQVINEEPLLGDSLLPTINEIKSIAGSFFQSQNRAVTAKDYEALVYSMPSKYGSIKRCKATRDPLSSKNNINLHVVSLNNFDNLVQTNTRIKENLKNWLAEYKILTDTIDILDVKIINLKIIFNLIVDPRSDRTQVLSNVRGRLTSFYSTKSQIGEPFNKLDVLREIRKVSGILDVKDLEIKNLTGNEYSSIVFNIEDNTTSDGNLIVIPKNAIYEIKRPDIDIVGNII